jgi:hypothetical protein
VLPRCNIKIGPSIQSAKEPKSASQRSEAESQLLHRRSLHAREAVTTPRLQLYVFAGPRRRDVRGIDAVFGSGGKLLVFDARQSWS